MSFIRVRRIKNISKASVPVQVDERTTVYIAPGEELHDKKVFNFESIKEMVKASFNLSEVPTSNLSSLYLKS